MYSAFSERSPCAAASATAWVTLGRSSRHSSLELLAQPARPGRGDVFRARRRRRPEASHALQIPCGLCRTRFYRNLAVFCGTFHGHFRRGATNLLPVATKYYTHFVTHSAKAPQPPAAAASGAAWWSCGSRWNTARGTPRTARAAGTEFRPGLGRHQDPALGPIALTYPLADFLPFIESPPLQPQASKPGVFFAPLNAGVTRGSQHGESQAPT